MKTKTVAFERFEKAERNAKEALRMASTHDPDVAWKYWNVRCNAWARRNIVKSGKVKPRSRVFSVTLW
jgi:hypothetical protein